MHRRRGLVANGGVAPGDQRQGRHRGLNHRGGELQNGHPVCNASQLLPVGCAGRHRATVCVKVSVIQVRRSVVELRMIFQQLRDKLDERLLARWSFASGLGQPHKVSRQRYMRFTRLQLPALGVSDRIYNV